MRGFLDTSSLCKKYIEEDGSDKLTELLDQLSQVIISPVCWLEMHSAIERRLHEKTIMLEQTVRIYTEMKKDFHFFAKVIWDEDMENKSIEFIRHYRLRTLDSVQMAAAFLSQPDIFITSDRKLSDIARKEFKKVQFI